ncbi:MAG: hypothetical protein AABY64_12020 [Bdellovibrionota bacterium]
MLFLTTSIPTPRPENCVTDSAMDTAANSILSRHVLKKSVELLVDGRGNIGEMNNATENVKHSIQDLKLELNGISDISKLSKMIAINLAIESNRLGKNGTTFGTIASEMQRLDASIILGVAVNPTPFNFTIIYDRKRLLWRDLRQFLRLFVCKI